MANGSSRALAGLISLVVGFGIGCHPVPHPVFHPTSGPVAGAHLVRVHKNGTVDKPVVKMSRAEVVVWVSDSGSLAILFPKKGFPQGVTEPPFEHMIPQGDDWAVPCDSGDGFCSSGPVNLKLEAGSTLSYKYDQVVSGKRSDGMIIIKP